MATSKFPTSQYTSEEFVESCGAVLFNLSQKPKQVCLIQYIKTDEWLLPKGRRNCGESRRQAAVREVEEETGYKCHIQPVAMSTRAPQADDAEDIPDRARVCYDLDEPFMLTVRELDGNFDVKIIWWYIAAVDGYDYEAAPTGTTGFRAGWFTCDEAVKKLAFQSDCDILVKAISLVDIS
ncbi:NUDIX hydrolase domain-like protein [Aspergillus cavernicola]|uniref:NUDIX hydrolase domain-like protein n=1 Tax=Aspergillus cavernicola TaxID=176166 RepID=A0ABR4IVG5_9EURO